MWLDIIKLLYCFATKTFEHKHEVEEKKKEKLATLFESIAELLKLTAEELTTDNYPIGSCAAMSALSEELSSTLRGHMDEQDINLLVEKFQHVTHLEHEYANRKNPETIATLYEVSGQFKGLALIYKSL